MLFRFVICGGSALVLWGCTSAAPTPPGQDAGQSAMDAGLRADSAPPTLECDVQAPEACPQDMPSWSDVEPLFEERCVVCHYGEPAGPWPLTDYGHVSDWTLEIRGAMLDCSMPPANAEQTMTNAERELILAWLRCGLPR